jgi:aspartyl protease family protein
MKNIIYLLLGLLILSSCAQSGRREPNYTNENGVQTSTKTTKGNSGKTVIKMEKKDGVYQIPIEINGVKMYFIFDTGAGMVSISATEAGFLYKQGTLTDDDILGTANFIDANGNISEGTVINLKTVKVGNRMLTNIQASVVHNMKAPLLLGQSVLEEFGKISIDNKKGEITFE